MHGDRFLKEFEQRVWASDIELFDKYKKAYNTTEFDSVKKFCHKRMIDLQAKWPQFIKLSEIPS